jgi:transcription antitermination factor NusG
VSYWTVIQANHKLLALNRKAQPTSLAEDLFGRAGFETYLPRIKVRTDGIVRIRPLFASYCFVRVSIERWSPVAFTPGVIRVLMNGEHPAALNDKIIDAIRRREKKGFVQLPRGPQIGEQVRVVGGQFAGHIGLYAGQTPHERERVLLELLGRSVRVELAQADRVEGMSP